MTLGGSEEQDALYEEMALQLKEGDSAEAVNTLIEIALDSTWYSYVDFDTYPEDKDPFADEPRLSTPLHALGVLRYMEEAFVPQMARLLPLFEAQDETLAEEVGYLLGAMGEPAFQLLSATLKESSNSTAIRSGAVDALLVVAEATPELEEACLSLFLETLEKDTDAEVNTFIVCSLMELGAKETYPAIEEAYKQGRVDEDLLPLHEVSELFALVSASASDAPKETIRDLFASRQVDSSEEEEREVRTPYVAESKAGRNDPCPCGSGKKYKKCCGAN